VDQSTCAVAGEGSVTVSYESEIHKFALRVLDLAPVGDLRADGKKRAVPTEILLDTPERRHSKSPSDRRPLEIGGIWTALAANSHKSTITKKHDMAVYVARSYSDSRNKAQRRKESGVLEASEGQNPAPQQREKIQPPRLSLMRQVRKCGTIHIHHPSLGAMNARNCIPETGWLDSSASS